MKKFYNIGPALSGKYLIIFSLFTDKVRTNAPLKSVKITTKSNKGHSRISDSLEGRLAGCEKLQTPFNLI